MADLRRSPYLPAQADLYSESSTQLCALGARVDLIDGRSFVYSKAGATALDPGKLMQAEAPVANHLNCAVAAAAALDATSVILTLGATAVLVNAYREGWLHINDQAGEGVLYKVKEHAANAGSLPLTVYLDDKIRSVALTTSSEGTLTKNLYKDLIVLPTTATSIPLGVAPMAITAEYYFWLQVAGPAAVLIDGTVVIGQHVRLSDAVAGAVEPLNRDGTAEDEAEVGYVLRVNADTEYGLIKLNL